MKLSRLLMSMSRSQHFWPLVIVLTFGLLASRHLFTPGYFNMHDDLQMMRQFQMEKCFLDLQIPCRWVPDMGFGYGFPLFNFYPPLPYFVGELFRLIGFSFVDTAKALFAIAFIGSGITMYFFAKEFFGRSGGVLAAAFYIWAPYHSVDVFVRGAMNEAWALIWFPSILFFAYKLINSKQQQLIRNIILLALSWFGLFTSHNLMVMIFAPIFSLWCLFWVFRIKEWHRLPHLVGSGLLGLAFSAFFTIPVFLEQKFVHADTLVQGYFEYTAHFATISQLLFNRFWGYGPSVWMDADDKMSFQVGHLHWMLPLLITGLIFIKFFRTKRLNNAFLITLAFVLIGWFAAFMAHSRSTPLWQLVEPIKFVQFPWRFLTLVIFSFSFVVGSLSLFFPKKLFLPLSVLLLSLLLVLNWSYFRPEHGKMGPLTDEQKFTGAAWDLQRTAGIYDYLPKTAKQNPRDGKNTLSEVVAGDVEITNQKQGTNWASFDASAKEEAEVRVNIYKFPNWKTFIDGKEVENYVPEKEPWGRMYIKIPSGEHKIDVKLFSTMVRTISNIVSLLAWIGLLFYFLRNKWSFRW